MGAWGTGSFENDDAADWIMDLDVMDSLDPLREAFDLAADYVEAPEASVALAAAEVLLALAGKARPSLHESALKWALAHDKLDPRPLKGLAADAIIRVLGRDSELDQLWAESDEHANWRADVETMLGAIDLI